MPSSGYITLYSQQDMLQVMWNNTVQKYPHLGVITDSNYIHAILHCKTEEAQNHILNLYLKEREKK